MKSVQSLELTLQRGRVLCRSAYYTASDGFDGEVHCAFTPGVHRLVGDIDSGAWALSYLLSMYCHTPKCFSLSEPPTVTVNGFPLSLEEFARFACYLDRSYPLFAKTAPVCRLIQNGLRRTRSKQSLEEVRSLFGISPERFDRPLSDLTDELPQAMAAVAYSQGKDVFCFPWMSEKRLTELGENLPTLLDALDRLGKIVLLPVGVQAEKRLPWAQNP